MNFCYCTSARVLADTAIVFIAIWGLTDDWRKRRLQQLSASGASSEEVGKATKLLKGKIPVALLIFCVVTWTARAVFEMTAICQETGHSSMRQPQGQNELHSDR